MSKERGWCVWVTGLPGSGKSTVANLLLEKLKALNVHAQIVSVDIIRQYATPLPSYTEEERDIVYGALVFTAKMLTENGVNVLIDATGNRRRFRDQARQAIPRFMEAYLQCPLEVCMRREAKRQNTHLAPTEIYKRAGEGEAPTVPGVGVPYEEPLNPEAKLDSSRLSARECARGILDTMQTCFHLETSEGNSNRVDEPCPRKDGL
jgi:adenylylsulfate kinase